MCVLAHMLMRTIIGALLLSSVTSLTFAGSPPQHQDVFTALLPRCAWLPTHDEVQKLEARAADARSALYLVRSTTRDDVHDILGTTFCISKKHRLLVTSAHVVDPAKILKLVVRDYRGNTIRVRHVWTHPDILRVSAEGISVTPDKAPTGRISTLSPDVALIQLEPGTPGPFGELPLARPGAGDTLLGHAVVAVHFSSYVQPRWPRHNERPSPGRATGCVVRTGSLQTADPQFPERPWHIFLTAPTWGGASGSPVLLMDGTVIGIVNSFLLDAPTARILTYAISSDALWDLLENADRLEDTLLPKRDGRPLDIHPVDRTRRLPPSPTDEQRTMLAQAQKLEKEGWHAKAANVLEALCAETSRWSEPFTQRVSVWSSYMDSMWLAGTPLDPEDQITYAYWTLHDALSALNRDPTTLIRHLEVGYALCYIAGTTGDKAYAHPTYAFASSAIPGLRRGDMQARLLALRAYASIQLGQLADALRDSTAAIDMKEDADYYRTRSLVYQKMGQTALAAKDWQRYKVLRAQEK